MNALLRPFMGGFKLVAWVELDLFIIYELV